MNAPVNINVKTDGTAFKDAMPLYLLTGTLFEFQAILDKTYMGLAGHKRINNDDRSHFYALIQGIRHGSIETDIGIIHTGIQTAFLFLAIYISRGNR